ncbi:MAG: aldo/keto reductase [Actinobacteria bacterium]|jgi:aryl-alcohol dehydrogenase-like predicted oxidoreductase|uniref:Aryl-alcohol dehydrogenase-like predicted oxidoreductase n=1 Tax=Nocardioides marinus TaxID=374514 RepID=A0A7Z0C3E5_9ACTN|nr:aldo/keto reductase [Nocardioides marinus]MBU2073686.1 aldo/keto reductase [Actinomycetota bacterium]MBU2111106.1 aldo/keto reductase [Actinomycetota bacterium]NYI10177.1 aryl-alcohol dehydrogenase-like predicted oxidoreductase [Nocardioides marinus]
MQTREIGNDTVGRVTVGAVGLGLMTFDQTGAQPREQLLDTVRAALDAGVTLFDTADAYGPGEEKGADAQGENERLIASLLAELGVRDRVFLATKAGHVRTEGGGWDVDSSAVHLESAVEKSLERLGGDHIDLWQHHRPDPTVPYEEVVETLKRVHDAGKVRMVGLSNADPDQIRLAHSVLGDALVSVQNQFSPAFRSSAPEIEVCAELGLAFLPWSPLGGLNGAKGLGDSHPAFAEVASERGVSPQQVALAWELAQDPCVIPIPGAKRPSSITDSAAAADLDLTPEELARLDAS